MTDQRQSTSAGDARRDAGWGPGHAQQLQPQPFGRPGYPQNPYQQNPYHQGQFAPPNPYAQDRRPVPGQQPSPYQLPPTPTTPPASKGDRPKKGLLYGAIGGGLALILITVVAVVTLDGGSSTKSGGGGGTPVAAGGTPTLTAGWHSATGADDQEILIGSWVTEKYVIRATSTGGVNAYDLNTGSIAWTVAPPNGAPSPCAISPSLSPNGIGTIGFGSDIHNCTVVVGVNADTGQVLWSSPLADGFNGEPSSATTFLDGSVADIVSQGTVAGVNLNTGTPVWSYKARGQYCMKSGSGAGGVVLVADYCSDASQNYLMTALDGATGQPLWQKPDTGQVGIDYVWTSSPLVADIDSSSGTGATPSALDDSGNPTTINSDPIESADGIYPALSRTLTGTTVLLETYGNTPARSGIEAVDVKTGKPLWMYHGANKAGAVLAETQSTGGPIYAVSNAGALNEGNYSGSDASLVTLNPATGAATTVANLPASAQSVDFRMGTPVVVPGGGSGHPTLYFVSYGSTSPGVQEYK